MKNLLSIVTDSLLCNCYSLTMGDKVNMNIRHKSSLYVTNKAQNNVAHDSARSFFYRLKEIMKSD